MKFSDFHGLFFTTITLCCFIKGSSAEVKMGPLRKRNILKNSGIVPDVIDAFPKNILQIVYENQKEVAMGNNLSRWDTIEDPVEISYPAQQDSYYTIIMTDLDRPSRENPIHREWQHWVLVNIPGADWTQGFYLTDYIGILGEYEHAVHRYVFLLYKQPGQLNFTERVLDARPIELLRYKFSTRNFAEKYKLGVPLAANFFKSGEAPKRVSRRKSTKVKTTVIKSAVKITTPAPRSKTATEILAVERKVTTTTLALTSTSAKTSTKTRRKMKMTDVATTISVIPITDPTSSIGTTVTQKTWSTAFAAAVVPPEPLIQYEDIPDVVPDALDDELKMKTRTSFIRHCLNSQYLYIFTLVWLPNILTECPSHIVKEMKQLKIIPDLVAKPPPFGIQIEWENAEALFGNILQPDEIPEEPIEIFWHADKGKIHTLMLLDLDAPSPKSPRFREYLHWLVVNIPDHHFLDGECVASYLPPDTRDDPHRLAFLVFEQPTCKYIDIEKLKNYTELDDTAREKFSWRKFADKWELGSPLAINYFLIEKYGPSDPRARVNPPDTDEEGGWFNF